MSRTHEEMKAYVSGHWRRRGFTVTQEVRLPRGDGSFAVFDLCAIKDTEKYLIEVGQLSTDDREEVAKKNGYLFCHWEPTKIKRIQGHLLLRLRWIGSDINEAIQILLDKYYDGRPTPVMLADGCPLARAAEINLIKLEERLDHIIQMLESAKWIDDVDIEDDPSQEQMEATPNPSGEPK